MLIFVKLVRCHLTNMRIGLQRPLRETWTGFSTMKRIILICSLLYSSCNDGVKKVPDGSKLVFELEYHCYPYNVDVYKVNNLNIETDFYELPMLESQNKKCKLTKWTKFTQLESKEQIGYRSFLKKCDANSDLDMSLEENDEIYFSGLYQYLLNREGKKVKCYDRIYFLNETKKRFHLFNDINTLY